MPGFQPLTASEITRDFQDILGVESGRDALKTGEAAIRASQQAQGDGPAAANAPAAAPGAADAQGVSCVRCLRRVGDDTVRTVSRSAACGVRVEAVTSCPYAARVVGVPAADAWLSRVVCVNGGVLCRGLHLTPYHVDVLCGCSVAWAVAGGCRTS